MTKNELLKIMEDMGINKKILKAMELVDRKFFVLEKNLDEVYENRPFPIGYGQTISQPYTVALMLQELDLKKGDKVLEIGTGSGWNAALMSYIVDKGGIIYTVEIIKEIAKKAKDRLKNYKNIIVINTDGSSGLSKYAPYNKIILTAAPRKISSEFKKQLEDGGTLIAPIGEEYNQKLIKIKRKKDKFIERQNGDFIFVPLINGKNLAY